MMWQSPILIIKLLQIIRAAFFIIQYSDDNQI